MSNLGDFHSGCTIFDIFTTTDVVGRPSLLTGNPAPFLVVYKDAGAIGGYCTVIGAVLAINCNGMLGVNAWSVNTNQSPTFYACGHQYQVLLSGGCVTTSLTLASPNDSVCVSGYVVGRFSLMKDSSLKPLIHGCNAVATTSTGAVRINWAEIENKATAEALSCTTTFSVQSVVNSVGVPACTAIFSVTSVLNSVGTNITEQSIACTIWNSLSLNYDVCGSFGTLLDCRVSAALQPTVPSRRLDVTATGAAGMDWGNVENPATAVGLDCTTIFSTQSVVNSVGVPACTSIFSVKSVENSVGINPCSTVFRVETLSNTATSSILDAAITEPAGVFAWAGATLRNIVGWLGALSSNCVRQTVVLQTLRARDDLSTLATADLTCTATTVQRGSFT